MKNEIDKDQEVEFEFNKQVETFMKNEGTKNFILEALKSENPRFLGIEKEDDLFISRPKTGTWMYRVLSLKFAAWLDSAFELLVYSTIDDLLFGGHVRREQSFDKTFERYLFLQRHSKCEAAVRKALTSESIAEIRGLFEYQ